jgi:hypothetical protein
MIVNKIISKPIITKGARLAVLLNHTKVIFQWLVAIFHLETSNILHPLWDKM